jgi:DNA topoisomerase-3
VDSLARQKGLKPPRGYTSSGALCRSFLDQHAPGKAATATARPEEPGPMERAALSARTRAPAKARGAAGPRRPARKTGRAGPAAEAGAADPATEIAGGDTPLNIPFGNKEAALRMGARYRPGGWYAPAGVELGCFRKCGWL